MIAPILLGLVFVSSGFVAPVLLSRAHWLYRAPRLGATAWLIAAVSAALAALLAALTVAVPVATLGHGLADLAHKCLGGWRHYYGDASLVVVAVAAIAVALMMVRLVLSAVTHARAVGAVRRTQHAGLALLTESAERDVVIIPHPVPAAYCVPGRPSRIVVTDSVVRALGTDQVRAIVAHERAHLAGHHAQLVGLATVLSDGLGWLAPVFGRATREVTALVEMIADDAAASTCSAPRVVQALMTLASGTAPKTALAAGGTHLLRRIRRLTAPPRPLGRLPRWVARFCFAAGMAIPLATVVAPIAAALVAASCADPSHG